TFCSKNKKTGKLIRGILAQNTALVEKNTTKPAAFVWPTSKKK
ncbi:MAG TPA: DUF2132 domain-containing protein, partial [Colwellia sp.]|nr:DUF2132 domain-containing protein [Colwellia sp.]